MRPSWPLKFWVTSLRSWSGWRPTGDGKADGLILVRFNGFQFRFLEYRCLAVVFMGTGE